MAVVGKNPLRAAIIEEGLHAAGHMSVVRIDDTAELVDHIRAIDPDVILIDLETPSRDVLEQMFKVSRSVARPVAMFVDRSNAATIDAAIDAGVSAYIVDGLRKDRVKPILDTTMNRFNAFAKLKKGKPGARRFGLGSGFGLLPARRRGNERLVDTATGIGSQ
jgi:two-component system, response regulator / RNA-binding antiterminator